MKFKITNLETFDVKETSELPKEWEWVKNWMRETGEIVVSIGKNIIQRLS